MNLKDPVDEQAENVATLLGIDPGVIARNDHGLMLSPNQIDLLLTEVFANGHRKGYEKAINALKAGAETANAEGPGHNLDLWAVYLAGASLLETCNCRCRQGRHCGGCGHEGCGYKVEVGS